MKFRLIYLYKNNACNILLKQIGHAGELPQTLIQDFETNEDFLKKVHHVLLEVEVINGDRSVMPRVW